MKSKWAVHQTNESYLFEQPRAGVEMVLTLGEGQIMVALDYSEASELALALQNAVRGA